MTDIPNGLSDEVGKGITEYLTETTILVIDDQIAGLRAILDYLVDYGFTILVAEDGKSGLERARYAQPDLILLDVRMPGLDGFETCRRLKADESTQQMPVIFMTSLTEMEDKVTGFEAGGVDYITKPLQANEVLVRLNTHLTLHRLQQQLTAQNLQLQQEVIERQRTEEVLMEERNLLRTLIDNLPDQVYVKDRESRFVLINPAVMRDLGITSLDEAIGKTDFDFHPLELASQYYADEQAVTRSGQPLVNKEEFNIDRETGVKTWVLATKVPLQTNQGKNAGLIGIGRDITQRKQAEEALRQAYAEMEQRVEARTLELKQANEQLTKEIEERKRMETALRESEERLRLAAQASNIGLWDWDHRTNQVIFSREWKSQLGYEEHEISTDYSEWERRLHPDDLASTLAMLRDYLNGKYPEYAVEFRMQHKDGSYHWIYARGEIFLDASGKPARMLGCHVDITQRKQAEEELRASEARFRTFVDHATDAFFLHDDRGTILDVNRQACESLGYTREELVGMAPYDFDVDTDQPFLNQMGTRLDAREVVAFDTHHRRKDGTIFPVEVRIRPFSEGGRRFGVSLVRDITDRKRAQEALTLFRSLIDYTNDTIEVIDPETGRFLDVNENACLAHGYSREEFLTLTVPEINSRIANRPWEETMEELRRSGSLVREGQHRRKDGSEFPVEINVTYINLDRDYVLGVVRDITFRKQAEEEIQRRNRELALLNQVIAASVTETEAETILEITCRELALTFDVPQAAAALLNPQKAEAVTVAEYLLPGRPSGLGDIIPVAGNPSFQYLLSHKTPLVVDDAQNDPRLAPVHDLVQRRGIVSLLLIPLIIKEQVIGSLGLDSIEPRQFSAEEVRLAWSVADQVSGVLARLRLDQERQRLEEQYYQAQKMEAIGRLTGGVAHDFNNILTVIMGNCGLILNNLQQSDSLRSDLEQIQKAAERAASLTHQLLAFSRQQILQPRVVDLNDIVTNIERMLHRLIGEDIDLVAIPGPQLGRVKADPGQLEQVIVNLVVNARDAMPRGGKVMIETANVYLDEGYTRQHVGVVAGPYVMLAVSDTGLGMDVETQARIFEPFFTTKEQGKGTGLGLATVHGIVNQSGGHIWVYSEPEHGTTFKIYLPRVEATAEWVEPRPVATKSGRGWETILLVEDEDMVRELARRILDNQGYTVLAVRDGKQAHQLCETHQGPIHLLLTDVIMPGGMSGAQLAKELVSLRPKMKVMYMSGYTENSIVHHGVLDANIAFLPKPFVPDDLIRKVRDVLDVEDDGKIQPRQ